MKRFASAALPLLLVLSSALFAQAPTQINYQGVVMNQAGHYPDTTLAISFAVYDDPVLSNVIWSETQTHVQVVDGLFEVRLGSVTPLYASVFEGTQRWLGITIGADTEIFPRTRLVSVPYSLKVATIDGSQGGVVSGELIVGDKLTVGENANNLGKSAVTIGEGNISEGDYSASLGGQYNSATGHFSGAVAGSGNIASGQNSFIGGGLANYAEGFAAFIAGGNANNAVGMFSVAMGNQARALHDGSVVISANDCPT